jgi:hypothetical protein
MSVRREDNDGRWWKSLFRHGQRPALAQESPCQDHTIHKETACSVIKKKMFYINENKTMNKEYQSLPFLRSTLKALMK